MFQEHLEKMRLDIEKSAAGKSSAKASVTEKSGGTKVKQKRSFSKKFSLSFSRKSATSDVISSPLLTAPVQASQLLLVSDYAMFSCFFPRCEKRMLRNLRTRSITRKQKLILEGENKEIKTKHCHTDCLHEHLC